MIETRYTRTAMGQLLFDLAFTDLSERYLARKHGLSIVTIRHMRDGREVKKLRTKVNQYKKRLKQ